MNGGEREKYAHDSVKSNLSELDKIKTHGVNVVDSLNNKVK